MGEEFHRDVCRHFVKGLDVYGHHFEIAGCGFLRPVLHLYQKLGLCFLKSDILVEVLAEIIPDVQHTVLEALPLLLAFFPDEFLIIEANK